MSRPRVSFVTNWLVEPCVVLIPLLTLSRYVPMAFLSFDFVNCVGYSNFKLMEKITDFHMDNSY